MATFPGGIFGQIAHPQVDSRGPEYQADLTPKNPIGGKIKWNGRVLRYVKHLGGTGSVTPLAGGPAWGKTVTPAATASAAPVFEVTADQTDSVFGQTPVGCYMDFTTAPASGTYIWVVISGMQNIIVAASVEEDMIIGSGTDNTWGRIAAGSNLTRPMVGVRMEGASSGGKSPVMLLMDWF